MASTVFGAQAYRKTGRGQFERGYSLPCENADHARREAERMTGRRGIAGATAYLIPNYTREYGGDDPITIAAFGDVPAEARDALPF